MSNMILSATPSFLRPQPISAVATPLRNQITHSMPQEKLEVFKSLEPWVSKHVLPILKPVEKSWQPSEFLPDPTKPINDFMEEVRVLQDCTNGLPDEYFVALVGNMITEDALPTYQSILNSLDGTRDETASSPSPWATWVRGWSAEENRHGDLLRTYLYLSGRVDMAMIERTIQYLIGAGMEGWENNPYLGFVYTSIQERATSIAHGNTARLAKEGGDHALATICGIITADEKRHEKAYATIIGKLLEIDPNETMLAIGKMMRKGITMPGQFMYDGHNTHLFQHYSCVTTQLGIYTTNDYVGILEFFIDQWKLEKLEGLKGNGKREQDFVCRLPDRIRKLHMRARESTKKSITQNLKFSWIFNKEIII